MVIANVAIIVTVNYRYLYVVYKNYRAGVTIERMWLDGQKSEVLITNDKLGNPTGNIAIHSCMHQGLLPRMAALPG